jgi:hypothetical protein
MSNEAHGRFGLDECDSGPPFTGCRDGDGQVELEDPCSAPVADTFGASDAESHSSDDRFGPSEEVSECVDDDTLHQLPEPDIVFEGCGLSELESDTTDVEREPSELPSVIS